jgi:hypothetical protein
VHLPGKIPDRIFPPELCKPLPFPLNDGEPAEIDLAAPLPVFLRGKLLVEETVLLIRQINAAVAVLASLAAEEKFAIRTIETILGILEVVALVDMAAAVAELARPGTGAVDNVLAVVDLIRIKAVLVM